MESMAQHPLESTAPTAGQRLNALEEKLTNLCADVDGLKEQRDSRLPPLSEELMEKMESICTRVSSLASQLSSEREALLKHNPEFREQSPLQTPSGAYGGGGSNAGSLRRPRELLRQTQHEQHLPVGWEKGVTEENIPYYINHTTEVTQWDHPIFTSLMDSLSELNKVKYSAYRLALKLRKIQKTLCLDSLDLEAAYSGFEDHGLTVDRHDLAIEIPEMTVLLKSIYETLHEVEPDEVDVDLCTALALNWLLNVYDSGRVGQIRVGQIKVGLVLLCSSSLTEKYLHLFKLASTEKRMTPRQLGLLLYDCIQIPKYLGEIAAFGGSSIEPSVQSCFEIPTAKSSENGLNNNSRREVLNEINAKHFLKWLNKEPQAMVWLPVLHRLTAAETARHNVKCKACKANPIVGFRYHCLKCFNFDLCHNCFFVGATAKSHKADHPMQEYCTSTSLSVNLKNFGTAFRNSFRGKKYFQRKREKLGYLPVDQLQEGANTEYVTPATTPNASLGSRDFEATFGAASASMVRPRTVRSEEGRLDVTTAAEISLNSTTSLVERSTNLRERRLSDEHSSIANLCKEIYFKESTNRIDDVEDNAKSVAVEVLEKENKRLMDEYRRLSVLVKSSEDEDELEDGEEAERVEDQEDSSQQKELLKEAKELKLHSNRMETKMRMLEDHNAKLEAQLNRLKDLLYGPQDGDEDFLKVAESSSSSGSNFKRFGTLTSKAVIASELVSDGPHSKNKNRPNLPAVIKEDKASVDHR